MAPAYIIVDMLITDMDQYRQYMAAAPAAVAAAGGEYLVRGGQARAKRAGATQFFNLILVEGVDAPVI